jgi:formate-dependent nitrite reductase membrane component NrfD
MRLTGGGILLQPTETPSPTEALPTEAVENLGVVATEGATSNIFANIQWGAVVYWMGVFLIGIAILITIRKLVRKWRK